MTTAHAIDCRSALLAGPVAGAGLGAPAMAQPAPPADALAAAAAGFPALAFAAAPMLELPVEVGARLDAGPIVFQHGGMIAAAPHPAAPVARPGGGSA